MTLLRPRLREPIVIRSVFEIGCVRPWQNHLSQSRPQRFEIGLGFGLQFHSALESLLFAVESAMRSSNAFLELEHLVVGWSIFEIFRSPLGTLLVPEIVEFVGHQSSAASLLA